MGIGAVKAVFLDRDGVINESVVRDGKPYPPATIEEFRIYADAAEALGRLKAAGYRLIVVTNQPDVGRGTTPRSTVDSINAALQRALPVDEVLVCFHDDRDGCDCRKPKPGLLLEAAGRHGIDMQRSFMVGDRWRDIDCGAAAGCRSVLIDRGYRERSSDHPPDFRTDSLAGAAEWILGCD